MLNSTPGHQRGIRWLGVRALQGAVTTGLLLRGGPQRFEGEVGAGPA